MSFLDWFIREYQKGEEETRARRAKNEMDSERFRRFLAWYGSPEGRRAIAARTEQVLESSDGFPDTVYDMSDGDKFTISSRSAGVTLTGHVNYIDAVAQTCLRRVDGSCRFWVQGAPADILDGFGEGPFDDDERIAAALLRSNPRAGWPGRAVRKTHPRQYGIAASMWQEMTGEKLWGFSTTINSP